MGALPYEVSDSLVDSCLNCYDSSMWTPPFRLRWALALLCGLSLFVLFARPFPARCGEPLVLAVGEWAPYVSEFEPHYGSTTRVVLAAMREAGLEYKLAFSPWRRCLADVESGRAFGSFPYFSTPDREGKYLFSDVVETSRIVLFYRRDLMGEYVWDGNIRSLAGYRIGGALGYYYEKELSESALDATLTSTMEQAFMLLARGRVDFVLEGEVAGRTIVRRMFPENEEAFGNTDMSSESGEMYMLVSKRWPGAEDLVRRFNEGLRMVRAHGTAAGRHRTRR